MKTLFYFFLLVLPAISFAQQNIHGTIKNEEGKLLDGATIILSQNDKTVSKQMADQGRFILAGLDESSYELNVTLVGFKPVKVIFNKPYNDASLDSLMLVMKTDNKVLDEVVIAYKKPVVERKIDRLVFNVENSILASGGNALQAVAKAPGVQILSGEIKANNKSVTVYINGKPVHLSGDDLNNYLQNMPAANIANIEVLSNPSSKYDAQGGAIINIILKKIKNEGFNATIGGGYTQGYRSSFNGNTLLNYQKGKLNLYGNYSYADNKQQRTVVGYTLYQNVESETYWDRNTLSMPESKTNNYQFGADYKAGKNQMLGVLITGNNTSSTGRSTTITNVYTNRSPSADSILNTQSRSKGSSNLYTINLNYKIQLDTAGRSLNFDIDYVPYRNNRVQDIDNKGMFLNGTPSGIPYSFSMPSEQQIDIWTGKVDYEDKLSPAWTISSGAKLTTTTTKNSFDFYDIQNNLAVLNQPKSDYFQYKETTVAGYTSFGGSIDNWNFQGGLRAEYTRTRGYSLKLDSLNVKNYLRVFPTLFVTYKVADDHEFGFEYSKRIGRPSYAALNPAKMYSTPYSYSNGNPFLKPDITNSVNVSYTYHQNYTLSVSYDHTKDQVGHVTIQDNQNQFYYDTMQNIGSIKDFGVSLLTMTRPTSWWEINNSVSAYSSRQSSGFEGQTYNFHLYHYYLTTNHSFVVDQKHGLKAELSGTYTSKDRQGVMTFEHYYDISAGISKSLFHKRGNLNLTTTDIFRNNPY
jgi:outer membrane receptor protein involved in Fe transport